jgi:parallel beta-helix repeat protein
VADAGPLISRNAVYGNTANGSGGGICIWGANPVVENNAIYHNAAGDDGGGLYMSGEASPTISSNTVYSNAAGSRGDGILMRGDAAPVIRNDVLVSNSGEGIGATVASPTMDYNDVWGNWPSDYSGGLSAGPNSISADPMFADAATGDLRLREGSPPIDAATSAQCPSTDIRGVWRPVDGDADGTTECDMGAYEYCSCDSQQIISCGQHVTGGHYGPREDVRLVS